MKLLALTVCGATSISCRLEDLSHMAHDSLVAFFNPQKNYLPTGISAAIQSVAALLWDTPVSIFMLASTWCYQKLPSRLHPD